MQAERKRQTHKSCPSKGAGDVMQYPTWNDMAGPVGDAHFLDEYFDELSLKGQTPEYAPSV